MLGAITRRTTDSFFYKTIIATLWKLVMILLTEYSLPLQEIDWYARAPFSGFETHSNRTIRCRSMSCRPPIAGRKCLPRTIPARCCFPKPTTPFSTFCIDRTVYANVHFPRYSVPTRVRHETSPYRSRLLIIWTRVNTTTNKRRDSLCARNRLKWRTSSNRD